MFFQLGGESLSEMPIYTRCFATTAQVTLRCQTPPEARHALYTKLLHLAKCPKSNLSCKEPYCWVLLSFVELISLSHFAVCEGGMASKPG